jgi:hypothetical protein
MATFLRGILSLVSVGIVYYETISEAPVILQWESVEERHYRLTQRRGRRLDRRLIHGPFILDDDAGHLAGRSEELDMLALNECRVASGIFKKRPDGTDGKVHEDRMVRDLLDGCLLENSAAERAHETDHTALSRSSSLRLTAEPELNLTRDDFVIVSDTLSPVVEYAGLDQTISQAPGPHVMQLVEEIAPLPEPTPKNVPCLVPIPQRQHLLQRLLIREDQKQAPSQGFISPRRALSVREEEIIIRRDVLSFELPEPLEPIDVADRDDEVVDRADGLQDDDLLGHKTHRLGL